MRILSNCIDEALMEARRVLQLRRLDMHATTQALPVERCAEPEGYTGLLGPCEPSLA